MTQTLHRHDVVHITVVVMWPQPSNKTRGIYTRENPTPFGGGAGGVCTRHTKPYAFGGRGGSIMGSHSWGWGRFRSAGTSALRLHEGSPPEKANKAMG